MTNEQLKYIANSESWEILKVYLRLFIDKLDRVSEPMDVYGIQVSAENAYMGKLLATHTLKEFIDSVDKQKDIEVREKDIRDSME